MSLDEIVGRRTTRRAPLTMRFAESIAKRLTGARSSRRNFLTTTAVAGSALTVAPWRFLSRPVSAYDAVCGPASDCASGWTVFCCTINNGRNSCPPGSIAAGWWKADQNNFCGGSARYYIDCNSTCGTCGCGSSGICDSTCWPCACRCNDDPNTCDHRRVCCNRFRYGNCNQHLPCVGPVVCRVVSCVPPWEWAAGCTTVSATANQTGAHHAPCLDPVGPDVYAFGDADDFGDGRGRLASMTAGIAALPDGSGFWLASTIGGVRAFGAARRHGSLDNDTLGKPIVDIAATATGNGYWLVNSNGRVWTFGDAVHHGSTNHLDLVKGIVAMAATPSGNGYWLTNSNGRVFAFGDADHHGSTDPLNLSSRIVAIEPTPSGNGYWLVSARGGVYPFGDAGFHGHALRTELNGSVVDMAATPDGGGYRLVTSTGRVHVYGNAQFRGGMATVDEPHGHIAGIASTPTGRGYWIATSPR